MSSVNVDVNRVSISPAAQSAADPIATNNSKISSSLPNPDHPGALALLVEATEQSEYLSAEANAPVTTIDPNSMSNPATSNDSIPQDVAFSPGRNPQDVSRTRIPKKENLPAPIASVEGIQLPPGVTLPDSVTPEVLSGKPIRMLLEVSPCRRFSSPFFSYQMRSNCFKLHISSFQLPQKAMVEALAEFDSAVKEKGNEIRSLPAYLVGVIKRYRTIQQASSSGGRGFLSERVLARLDQLVSAGYCSQAEIDDKIKNKLAMMTENEGLSAIGELSNIKREDIRSFSSYFMGIMNRYGENV